MFRFKNITLASVAAFALMAASSADAMTLAEALKSAYESNPSLNADRASQKSNDEKVPQALSGFLPSAQYKFTRQELKTTRSGTESDIYGYDQTLSLSQPLFSGGSTVARTISAKNQVMSGREGLRNSEQEILLKAITAYNDVIRDKATFELSKSNREVLQKRLDMTRERFKVGELTKTDVAQSESRFATALASVAQAEAQYNGSLSVFEEVVQMKPDNLEAAARLGKSPENQDEALKMAYELNPALRSSRFLEKSAKNDVFASVGDILPDLTFTASDNLQHGASSFISGAIREKEIALNLTVPLYQSGAEWSRLRQAKRIAESRKEGVSARKNEVTSSIIKSWEALKSAEATIEATREAVRASELAVQGTQMEADLGTRTTLELLDTQQELFQTQVSLVKAERDANVAYYSLLSNMGILTAKDLGLDVKIYDPKSYYNRVKFEVIGW